DDLETVRAAMVEKKIPISNAEVTMLPQNYVDVSDETTIKNIRKILDLLDADDDVQAVYYNWNE
ncbi:MAG: YebC/PmpR family DNA-binding transcriptional regulator, partial [Lachnospiraceae bacterium]|nr:YebC/PmpR family DNA-binding transcriptional regulator [Lachnospiraceae bacterium]